MWRGLLYTDLEPIATLRSIMESEVESHGLPTRTVGEEIANTLTHGAGLALSLTAMAILLWKAATNGDAWHSASCAVFGEASWIE